MAERKLVLLGQSYLFLRFEIKDGPEKQIKPIILSCQYENLPPELNIDQYHYINLDSLKKLRKIILKGDIFQRFAHMLSMVSINDLYLKY